MATPSDIGKQLVTQTPVVAGGLLRSIVDFAIDGNSSFPGAKAAAAKALEAKTDREQAIDSLVVQHVGVASAQGFVTSVGGLLTLPVGLPANIAGMATLSVRMIAGIAHLRGYDVDDPRVRTAITLLLLGEDEVRKLVAKGSLPTRPLAIATAPMFDSALDRLVSEKVMGSMAGRLGGKHLAVVIVRRIPLIGGGVGAAVDGLLTFGLAAYTKREFVARQQLTRGTAE